MPGMMDTILNLGLNDEVVAAMIEGNPDPKFERFVYDSYRRFIQMFSDVVMELPKSFFERVLDEIKESKGAKYDTALNAEDMKEIVVRFKEIYKEIDSLEKSKVEQTKYYNYDEMFRSWQLAALLLFGLEIALRGTLYKGIV